MGRMKEFALQAIESQTTSEMVRNLLHRLDHTPGALIGVPESLLCRLSDVLECEHVNRLATTYTAFDDDNCLEATSAFRHIYQVF